LADIATVQRRLGKWQEGLESARQAVKLQPQFAWGHNILGLIQGDVGDSQGAKASFEQAIALRPDQPEAHCNLAKVFRNTGQFSSAVQTLRDLTKRSPRYVVGHANLGVALIDVGEVDEAIVAYRRALELNQDAPATRSNMLLCMNFSPKLSQQVVADEHRRWGVMHGLGSSPGSPPPMRRLESGKPLRVGYVSADLYRHPVASFFEPILKNHDPASVQVFVYSDVQRPDDITARLKLIAPQWTDMAGRSSTMLEKVIRSDQIDILVDLGGHTELNRLEVFARKPAPVQVSYLGYPNTTGLVAMDYRLTDAWADPPGSEPWYTEKLVRLPRCFLCYQPPADAPLPMRAAPLQSITFGSFNKLAKIPDEAIALWAKILAATANSRLILKDSATGDPKVCDALRARLQKGGIDPHRLTLEAPRQRQVDHLLLYHSIDIALDTFPYNGTTTTCEALWMGVPVITLAGEAHASRVSLSILHAIGYGEWAAQSPEEYVRLAVTLAADHSRRCQLREGLRQNMAQSPLMDAKGFVTALEAAYQQMWRERCPA
jgi:predicted O-linked N-acetylglucosamine transferase (SPINDLY family)